MAFCNKTNNFHLFQAMSYSSFIFKQAEVPENTIPYVIVGQGAINVIATIVCVSVRVCVSSIHPLSLSEIS